MIFNPDFIIEDGKEYTILTEDQILYRLKTEQSLKVDQYDLAIAGGGVFFNKSMRKRAGQKITRYNVLSPKKLASRIDGYHYSTDYLQEAYTFGPEIPQRLKAVSKAFRPKRR